MMRKGDFTSVLAIKQPLPNRCIDLIASPTEAYFTVEQWSEIKSFTEVPCG